MPSINLFLNKVVFSLCLIESHSNTNSYSGNHFFNAYSVAVPNSNSEFILENFFFYVYCCFRTWTLIEFNNFLFFICSFFLFFSNTWSANHLPNFVRHLSRSFPLLLLHTISLVSINFSRSSFLIMQPGDVNCHFLIYM